MTIPRTKTNGNAIPGVIFPKFLRKHLSLASRYRLVANYLEGMSFEEMSITYGIADNTIRYIVRRMGGPHRPKCFKGHVVETWRKKYAYD